ncbi:MAG: sulfotransferase domain-containing protein [Alphaproteobacteria bacterium]|nr:sulfotransferase domain-containing protein [Alphaproteobacteria bacterium]
MLVLCTGMIRSGSTWSFNVVRLLLGRASPHVLSLYTDNPTEILLKQGINVDHLVIKCHQPNPPGRALIKHRLCRTIYTYREPIECLTSGADLGMPFQPTLERLRDSLELFQFQLAAGGVHMVWYDDITSRPRDRVRAIADYLELDASDETVDSVSEMLSYESVRHVIRAQGKSTKQIDDNGLEWDPKTLFNARHIRDNPSNPATVINAGQRTAIAKALSAWTDATGRLRLEVRALGMLTAPDLEEEITAEPAEALEIAAPAPENAAAPETAPLETAPAETAPAETAPPEAATPEAAAASRPDLVAADAPAVVTPAPVAPAPMPAAVAAHPTPLRPAAERPTEATKLKPAAVAERQRLARELLRIIDTQRPRSLGRR